MSRSSSKAGTKSAWRRGETKAYGIRAVTNLRENRKSKKEKA